MRRRQPHEKPPAPFSLSLFAELYWMWRDWQNGIPPGRRWRGRGAQNPRLLQAFAMLDLARGRAESEAYAPPKEPAQSFEQRIRREVLSG